MCHYTTIIAVVLYTLIGNLIARKMESYEGRAWTVWITDLNTKAASTRGEYLRYFKRFLERWDMTPEALFEMRKSDVKSDDPRDAKRIESMVKTQMAEIREAGFSASTCRLMKQSVSSFFEAQGLELRFKSRDTPRGVSNGQRIILADMIREIHDNMASGMKYRNRAVLMLLKDTGLRISDIAALNVGHYMDAEEVTNEFNESFKVLEEIATKKTGAIAYPHLGPEAIAAVYAYLVVDRMPEGGGKLIKDSPLFLNARGERIKTRTLTGIFTRQKRRLGKRGRRISAHSLRKFHLTRLETVMPQSWIYKLQGRTVRGSSAPYSLPEQTEGELTQAYINGYDRLRVFGKEAEKEKRTRDLEEEVERLNVVLREERSKALEYERRLGEDKAFMMQLAERLERLEKKGRD